MDHGWERREITKPTPQPQMLCNITVNIYSAVEMCSSYFCFEMLQVLKLPLTLESDKHKMMISIVIWYKKWNELSKTTFNCEKKWCFPHLPKQIKTKTFPRLLDFSEQHWDPSEHLKTCWPHMPQLKSMIVSPQKNSNNCQFTDCGLLGASLFRYGSLTFLDLSSSHEQSHHTRQT